MAAERRGAGDQPPQRRDDDAVPLRIHTCTRVGMQANPPRAGLGGRLRRH